jgi:hypothetical protein
LLAQQFWGKTRKMPLFVSLSAAIHERIENMGCATQLAEKLFEAN